MERLLESPEEWELPVRPDKVSYFKFCTFDTLLKDATEDLAVLT